MTASLLETLRYQQKHPRRRARRKRRRFKQRVYWRDRGLCAYCEKFVPFDKSTLDHITPLAHGGSDRHKENFCIACHTCNKAKAQLMLEDLGDLSPEVLAEKFAKAYAEASR